MRFVFPEDLQYFQKLQAWLKTLNDDERKIVFEYQSKHYCTVCGLEYKNPERHSRAAACIHK